MAKKKTAKKRGMPTKPCVKCGAMIHARKTECPKCGAKQPVKEKPAKTAPADPLKDANPLVAYSEREERVRKANLKKGQEDVLGAIDQLTNVVNVLGTDRVKKLLGL